MQDQLDCKREARAKQNRSGAVKPVTERRVRAQEQTRGLLEPSGGNNCLDKLFEVIDTLNRCQFYKFYTADASPLV